MARKGRRQFIGGLLAASLIPKPAWADAGSPAFLAAAALPDGTYVLCGIDATLQINFQIPLPARGHAAAAHPTRPEAVAFARRPGTFATVINCITGQENAHLAAPIGRHFYGHGTYSLDGKLLFTTENDYEAGAGRIGVWDVDQGYARVDEWDSFGVGPHDIKRLPNSDILVVANGGIDTHPDTGRTKLNVPTMHPNLAYIEDGVLIEKAALPDHMQKNSIRHLAVNQRGDVAFGMQWQGDRNIDALIGTHHRGGPMKLVETPINKIRQLDNYIGSLAFSGDGKTIAATSPRGGVVHLYDVETSRFASAVPLADVSGVAPFGASFAITSGTGQMRSLAHHCEHRSNDSNLSWDNHLVPLTGVL